MNEVSVIIPVFKVEKYLKKCLDSVISQTYDNLQIIIVDDGSPDNCGKICDEYESKDARIKVIHKDNEGLCAARNDALKLVTGKWVLFVDSDDWCELDLVEKTVKAAEEKNVDILMFNPYRNMTEEQAEKIQAFPKEFETTDKDIISGMQLSALNDRYTPMNGRWCQGFPWDKLFRASMIRDNDLKFATNVRANEDVIFNIHAFQFANKIAYIDETLYHYRYNPTSIAYKYTPDRVEIDREIYYEMYSIGKKYDLSESYFEALKCRTVCNNISRWGLRCFFHKDNKDRFSIKCAKLKKCLCEEPFYEILSTVNRSMLWKSGKFITVFRHHNVLPIFLLTLKLQLFPK